MDPYTIIKYPLSTEKAVRLLESENKLVFIVDKKATKQQIKEAIEKVFKIKTLKITTLVNKGKKKAYVKLTNDHLAIDVASQLGIM